MVEMSLDKLGSGIDVIHAVPAGRRAQPLPTIFFFHGYCSSKEVYSYFGYALAQAGFRVILPDAAMHGARYDGNDAQRLRHFWDILQSNIEELPEYVAEYRQRGLIDGERVGVCGASLGGMSALGCMARYPWITAVAAFMGSGYFSTLSSALFPPVPADGEEHRAELLALATQLADYDVTTRLEALSNRPLLVWHGEADDVVPAAESARLHQALKQQNLDRNLTYVVEKGVGHRITPTALQAGETFFSHYLTTANE
ncbi:esterase [Pectobacterium araliae]|uniref:Esterase n=1 Tax=Pectobacterium araliae TaxID=3073862 RepID=A0AAN0KC11_9GAMM|nr:esterase [Pectobacterium sp. MAFF 302110]GKW18637.1 esterase [Pectobacterium carotovorum subsp. carotovorum]